MFKLFRINNYRPILRCNQNSILNQFKSTLVETHSQLATEHQTTTGVLPVTTQLNIIDNTNNEKIPVFRILDLKGVPLPGAVVPKLDADTARKMYKTMITEHTVDDILYNAQRQGRISFYMQNSGEEACHIGCASALNPNDVVFSQYREFGVLLWRGFTVQQAADQCFSNEADSGKGRSMPVHYGSKTLNFQSISSPLTTQLPHAVGAAYNLKLKRSDAISIVFFGEGAASEGDFHAALNFSATLDVPMIFFCRNNGYAISTPVQDQYRGDGIASRAAGYGMHCIRVDGNDLLAVKQATEVARALALEKSKPVLIEAMTYRRGHHSTSDDSSKYRSVNEIKYWQDHMDPIKRFRLYIESQGWWDSKQDQEIRDSERLKVLEAVQVAEKRSKPPVEDLFTDVYHEIPSHLLEQKQALFEHIEKYPEHYDLNKPH